MDWLYHRKYFGPNRRKGRFEMRFLERRKRDASPGTRASLQSVLRELFERGLIWVDAASYFGPDRRASAFSHFVLDRRRRNVAGAPPPLHAALRQLRMRVLEADDPTRRSTLKERLIATALLADAQGFTEIGDKLARLAEALDGADADKPASDVLPAELLAAEALLADAPSASA